MRNIQLPTFYGINYGMKSIYGIDYEISVIRDGHPQG